VETHCVRNYECLFVVLVIQHAMHMRPMVFCGLSGSPSFFHIILKTARFAEKVFEHKSRVLILLEVWKVFHF